VTYFDAREEIDELLDGHLAQAASLLVGQISHDIEEIETEHAPPLHKYSRDVAFQVWERGRKLRLHSANAPNEPLAPAQPGFSTRTVGDARWRVFSSWDASGTFLIQVGERVARRDPANLTPLDSSRAPAEVVPLIEQLNRLFARIAQSLENERRFTADAAHELRTPVAAIKAQAQVARNASSDAGKNRAIDNVILGCDHAAHLVDQLLTLARLDQTAASTMEPCRLRAIAADVLAEMAAPAYEAGVSVELAEGEDVHVQGVPALL